MLTDNRRTEILDIGQYMFSFGSYDLNINVHARIQKFPGPQEWVLTFLFINVIHRGQYGSPS